MRRFFRYLEGVIRAILPSSSAGRVVFVSFFVLGVLLRTLGLDWGVPPRANAPSFYHDEGHVLAAVELDWTAYWQSFGLYEVSRPVMFYRLLGRPLLTLVRALGLDDPQTRVDEFITLRSINAAFSILGLLGVYLLGRALGGTQTGLWALAILSAVPGHWYYGQILKGDVLIATLFTFALLLAFHLVERGSWGVYLGVGALLGFGVSLKPTMLVAVPFLAFAHLLRTWRLRSFRFVAAPRALAAVVLAVAVFFLLYPYPYRNPERYRAASSVELFGPAANFLTFRGIVSPRVYRDVWRSYTEGTHPFMDMVYGRFLHAALVPSAMAAIVFALLRLRRGDPRLFLAVVFAGLFFHSLTFIFAYDDRYLVPGSAFVVVFAALAASGAWLGVAPRLRAVRFLGSLTGLALIVGTAAVTFQVYPAFGFRDPREATVSWIHREAQRHTLVAQPTLDDRWALVFDSTVVEPTAFVKGEGKYRHVMRRTRPHFAVVQRTPWNYDHTFKDELKGIEHEVRAWLSTFERVQTFGREPRLFGTRLPHTLGTPVIDVYRRSHDPREQVLVSLGGPRNSLVLPALERQVLVFPRTFQAEELADAFVRVTVDLRGLRARWTEDREVVRVGVLLLWDGAAVPSEFGDLPPESTLLTKVPWWAWLTLLRRSDAASHDTLTILVDQAREGVWDLYDGFDGTRRSQTMGVRASQTVRLGVLVLGPEESLGDVRITEAVVARSEVSQITLR